MTGLKLQQTELQKRLSYDPLSGELYWKTTKRKTQAGFVTERGYRRICINGKLYPAHLVAWVIYYGSYPKNEIDHIDGNRNNNAISNLRDVTRGVNHQNLKRAMSHSKTGLLGVEVSGNRFIARIRVNGQRKYLGSFKDPHTAHQVYLAEKRILHEGCTI